MYSTTDWNCCLYSRYYVHVVWSTKLHVHVVQLYSKPDWNCCTVYTVDTMYIKTSLLAIF